MDAPEGRGARFRRLVRNRRVQIIAGAVVAVLVAVTAGIALVGGSGHRAATTTVPRATSTTHTIADRPGGVIAPLTGLRDLTSGSAHRPALTIKIENTNLADPQIGLQQADVVYEEVVEGQITRLLAIFQSHVPPVVGPVRSVRRTDQGVVTPIGGIFVYSGGAPYAVTSIRTAPVTLVDETRAGSAMFRDQSREKPHNLYGRPPQLFAIGGAPVPPPPLFKYRAAHAKVGGVAVTQLNVGFGGHFSVSYQWDAKHAFWNRSVDRPDYAASGVKTPRNVVVMFVHYAGGVGLIGSEAELVGQGDAVVFTAGHRIIGRWVRPDRARPAQFFDTAGKAVRLTPGQTWVELAPIGIPVTSS
jgi:Protein of unknown function (DUF3048) N-terminal domain/Protein of unknown function (DUF3048) C-terminal domain